MARSWNGGGPEFDLEWGGRNWTLRVDANQPGLRVRGEPENGPLLGLNGVAAVGRWDLDALTGATLTGFERRFERVEATYVPPGWDDLTVRAAWSPRGEDGVDLEIQVSALSVDRLKAVEVMVRSILPEPPGSRKRLWVEPRDARSAMLSYDGREPDLLGLTTLPPPLESPLAPRVLPASWPDGGSYVELVHPEDAARRITESVEIASIGHTTRYGLFGHDLEKGVVLRARLRGLWTVGAVPERFEEFLREPLPLGR